MATQPKDILTPDVFHNQSGQISLPNSTASLVLGILALVFCIGYGILGVILGGIGYYLALKDTKLIEINPEAYTQESINNLKAGKICSLIGFDFGFFIYLRRNYLYHCTYLKLLTKQLLYERTTKYTWSLKTIT